MKTSTLFLLQASSLGDFATLIFILIVLVLIFLVCREVNCWYWKINERNDLIRETNRLLGVLIDQNKFEFEHTKKTKAIESTQTIDLNNPDHLDTLLNQLKNSKGGNPA